MSYPFRICLGAPTILEVCGEELGTRDTDRVKCALECLETWIILPASPLTPDILTDIIGVVLELALESEVREVAIDVLVAIVRHPHSDSHPRLMKEFVPAANSLAAPYSAAIEEGDSEGAAEYARFAVSLADNHIRVSFPRSPLQIPPSSAPKLSSSLFGMTCTTQKAVPCILPRNIYPMQSDVIWRTVGAPPRN